MANKVKIKGFEIRKIYNGWMLNFNHLIAGKNKAESEFDFETNEIFCKNWKDVLEEMEKLFKEHE